MSKYIDNEIMFNINLWAKEIHVTIFSSILGAITVGLYFFGLVSKKLPNFL